LPNLASASLLMVELTLFFLLSWFYRFRFRE
jgi:hypothetical protein